MSGTQEQTARSPTAANRLCLDYRAEAERLGPPVVPIIDVHSHINGTKASVIFRDVAERFGVERIYSMTRLQEAPIVRDVLGEKIRFIAVPNFMDHQNGRAFCEGYLDDISAFHDLGARIVKFWVAPRSRDIGREIGDPTLLSLDHPWRIKAMELAEELGMMYMVHVADPDTWFATKYTDASFYGTKRSQYEALESALERFRSPWIAAHMGGWPEDLEFLSGLLSRHDHLYLDTSATKWMVRELSKHTREELLTFLRRWEGRILFGSDIVTTDQHLSEAAAPRGMGHLASTKSEAFELYAGRYWALRTFWETDYDGESNIADPDLAMLDPERHDAMSAPRLAGKALPPDLLRQIYHDNARALLDAWYGP
ncbi:MAG: amidohydrolase family protein [Phycisphaerales bacterium]